MNILLSNRTNQRANFPGQAFDKGETDRGTAIFHGNGKKNLNFKFVNVKYLLLMTAIEL